MSSMRRGLNLHLLLMVALGISAFGQSEQILIRYSPGAFGPDRKTVTLYSPLNFKNDLSRASFGFECGCRGARIGSESGPDLFHGSMPRFDGSDWFSVSGPDSRTVIRDLGFLSWSNSFDVPVLDPLPETEKAKRRNVAVDVSEGTENEGTQMNGTLAKVIVGHVYAIHVRNPRSDFYALIRVENIERGDNCTITWFLIPKAQIRRSYTELQWKVAVCKHTVSLLPAACYAGDLLTEENGGLVNIEVKLKCGDSITCQWACVQDTTHRKWFSVKHGPWGLCQLCFHRGDLPKACYEKPSVPAKPEVKTALHD